MNNLLSGPLSLFGSSSERETETTPVDGNLNRERFFKDVDAVKADMKEVEEILLKLKQENEHGKTLHTAKAVKELRSSMDSHITQAVRKAKMIKLRIQELERSNEANKSEPGCGQGSSDERMRSGTVHGLKKKLKEQMDEFQQLKKRISDEYRETIERRYFTVTGENPDDSTLDVLISTGQSETFLQKAIQEQGRGRILDTITEIQERHDAVQDIERNLRDLHQVFVDMALLVEQQGEQLDDIEANMLRAKSTVERGTQQLQIAKKHQKNTRKWTCYAFILLAIIIILAVVIPVKALSWMLADRYCCNSL